MPERPSSKELRNKVCEAMAVIEQGNWQVLADPYLAASLEELEVENEDALIDLIFRLLVSIWRAGPETCYAGQKPPAKSYMPQIRGLDLWAFVCPHPANSRPIYLKFALKRAYISMSVVMKTVRKPPRLVCLKCEGETFALAEGEIVQNFRGETLRVHTPVMRCVACGWETLGPGQVDALRLATAEAYRDRHGLLTASQIRAIREAAGLSQRAFAAALDVGEASIPRWESWQVQESAYDERIRRFASRAALRPLPTVRVLAGHVRMSATPITPWQQLVWSAMAQGLQTKGGPAPLPGLAAYEPRTIVQRTVRLPLNDDAGSSAEIEDDSFCAHA